MASIVQDARHPLPWSGPRSTSIDSEDIPTYQTAEHPASYPIENADNPNLFPPVCLRSHWDPEMIIRRSLPSARVSLPLDPRPMTKVCMEYVTDAPFEMAPKIPDSLVFPSGGVFYPPTRYRAAVDRESQLRRLDRPLGVCEDIQFTPQKNMYTPNATVPDRGKQNDRFIQELAFPKVLMRSGTYDCRRDNDLEAMAMNAKMFNNATKQNRIAQDNKGNY
jgi:hypothetical protein